MINPFVFIALPMGMAFLIALIGHQYKKSPDFLANLTMGILFILSAICYGKSTIYYIGNWSPSIGIPLVLDGLSGLMLIIINFIGFMSAIFSIQYIEKFYTSKLRYYGLFLLTIAGLNGIVLSGDIFSIYVFLELASISSYALVGFGCGAEELEAAFKYLIMGTIASFFILLGIALLYGATGNLNLAAIANVVQSQGFSDPIKIAFIFLISGFFIKAASIPFHSWLPDAHSSAPSSISAILSGIVVKITGIYCIIRLVYNVFGATVLISHILLYIGLISIILAGIMAFMQTNIKRTFAYSTISQLGYVFFALGIGTPLAIFGAMFQLFNHAIFKPLLFLNSGSVDYQTGEKVINKMGKLNEKMPVTSTSTLIGSLSISGIPPFNGFWSKLIIIIAAVQANLIGPAIWAIIGSILTLSYYSKVLKCCFFGKGAQFNEEKWKSFREVPGLMLIPVITLAFMCIIGGIFIIHGYNGFFGRPVKDIINGPLWYIQSVFGSYK
ncbi:MAG: NADH/ubiquinone/plastoquinone (complex I) [Candidatus Omnitrophica bacterium]|jgi:multicomponent Na+:H+ antiporter subunit D|nr:NADH/ubiquinone/plastoquinone (complex I) [Candidatus Omnitrophota bacterium]